jgi:hypothetical protein
MKIQKLCHVFLYHDCIVFISEGFWYIDATKYDCVTFGNEENSDAAIAKAKSRVDKLLTYLEQQEQG